MEFENTEPLDRNPASASFIFFPSEVESEFSKLGQQVASENAKAPYQLESKTPTATIERITGAMQLRSSDNKRRSWTPKRLSEELAAALSDVLNEGAEFIPKIARKYGISPSTLLESYRRMMRGMLQ
ncbi:unnamed protein product [Gongylonema pulchrum]|uniref:HTH psq-type domain-containing protein n=1 Tax=Gongylonema pulchrum TaxID=637853 RepID=A0A183DR49_9BILA|nr:unnamed protein product [Gongylonema pulchrum]